MADDENARDRDEVERYRQAAEDALQQLDWCIGYLHGIGKRSISRGLARNRSHIRTHVMRKSEQPLPTQQLEEQEDREGRAAARAPERRPSVRRRGSQRARADGHAVDADGDG